MTRADDYHDLLNELYEEFDTRSLREHQMFIDVFPPIDSQVALDHWLEVEEGLTKAKSEIKQSFIQGDPLAEIAAQASREEAFTALELYDKYQQPVTVLVLDVDETLRSAGGTDNEIPRETLSFLTKFYEKGVPIVICTGQTLENVKGFLIQGLGSEVFHSGDLSVVYEAGTGVFTPGHGPETKRLLYEDLAESIQDVFYRLRSQVLSEAPEEIRQGCHLQGNEFNITLKPNFEIGSQNAVEIIDQALVHQLKLLGSAVSEDFNISEQDADAWARAFYADADPEIRAVLEAKEQFADRSIDNIPEDLRTLFDRIDVAYYEGDAAEIGSLELNKVVGVEAAFDVLSLHDPFALMMGDSKSDLRVMQWIAENDMGIAAAPEHASIDVLDHVIRTNELIYDQGDAATILRIVSTLNQLDRLE